MTDNFIISILNTLGKEEEYVIIFINNLFIVKPVWKMVYVFEFHF